jgi:sucrose phosphorylase
MKLSKKQELQEHLEFLYGKTNALDLCQRILKLLEKHCEISEDSEGDIQDKFSQKDVILITYGDMIQDPPQSALGTLKDFLDEHLSEQINTVHILPFFPYSSDDGFSVIDYRAVDPEFGTWENIRSLAKSRKIMVDAVINHISRESHWFKAFLKGDPDYQDYFIQPDENWDLSNVVRPRTSPLLTEVKTDKGYKKVWTTFSADQIDLNYANPEVLFEVIDILLFYLRQGATIIRLDAIAYLWKQSGTTCIHLPQTHRIIKLLRLILETASPDVVLITETNVPHDENIRYFGEYDPVSGQTDEAHMVYQFPLAPLVLHTLIIGNSRRLMDWVSGLGDKGIFLNFIASHDGIGLLPARGILSENEIVRIIDQVRDHGGLISHRSNPDGTKTVYELNTTLYDALNDPEAPNPPEDIARFLASQVMLMSLAGVPGIYYHSLFGSRNAVENVQITGRARSINRKKFSRQELEKTLKDPENTHTKVFHKILHLLSLRVEEPAFHPRGSQKVMRIDDRIFGLERYSPDNSSGVLVLVNVSSEVFDINIGGDLSICNSSKKIVDIISGETFMFSDEKLQLKFMPYQYRWLRNK